MASNDISNGTVETRTFGPAKVAFLEHVGPYWRIGPLLDTVAELIRNENLPGPVFIRYAKNPARSLGTQPNVQIGCPIPDSVQIPSPFQVQTWEPLQIAARRIGSEPISIARSTVFFESWAKTNDWNLTGTVYEFFEPVHLGSGKSPQLRPTEIAFGIVIREKIPLKQDPPNDDASNEILTVKADSNPINPIPPEANQLGHASVERVAVGTSFSSRSPEVPPKPTGPTVRTLILNSQYEEAAEGLVSAAHLVDSATFAWVRVISGRISAAARGLEKLYPGEPVQLTQLAQALSRKLQDSAVDTAVARGASNTGKSEANDSQAQVHRTLLREFDRLLSRISVRGIAPKESLDSIAELLQQVHEQLMAETSVR